jgi:hypothetical protein
MEPENLSSILFTSYRGRLLYRRGCDCYCETVDPRLFQPTFPAVNGSTPCDFAMRSAMRVNVSRNLPITSVDSGLLRLAPPGDREDDMPRRAPARPVRSIGKICPTRSKFGTRPAPRLSKSSRSPPMPASVMRHIMRRHASTRTVTLPCATRTASSPAGAARSTDIGALTLAH